MPAVCRFYLKGYCRYGNNCRFEHPGAQQETPYNNSSNFSFKAALNEIGGSIGFSPINQPQRPQPIFDTYQSNVGSTGGFSFTQTYEAIKSNPVIIDDVDMSADVINQPPQTNLFSTSYISNNRIGASVNAFGPAFESSSLDQSRQQQVTAANPNFTNLTELDDAELKAYQTSVFEFRAIPIKPPPRELC